jgi:hypothetical protein
MRPWIAAAILSGAVLVCGAASAAATVDIRNAALEVTVIPEARSDVAVTVVKTYGKLPVKVTRDGQGVRIDGGVNRFGLNCHSGMGWRGVSAWGRGDVRDSDLPRVVIRTPMDVSVRAGGAVFGVIGRGGNIELSNGGCGDWTVADAAGSLRLAQSGSGDLRAGAAGSADVSISGSGDVSLTYVRGGLRALSAGSGDLSAVSVDGPLFVRISGAGDVIAKSGSVTIMDVAVAGSGDVRFGGVAQSLDVAIAGSGDVSAAHVTGLVDKRIAGSGDVTVGR